MTDTPAEVAEALNNLPLLAGPGAPSRLADDYAATIRAHIADLQSQLAAQRERDGRDAERLDFIAPGFKVLAGDHVLQVWWMEGKESRVVSVRVGTPDAVRTAIDAALKDRP